MTQTTPIAKNNISISLSLFKEGAKAGESKSYKKSISKVAIFILIVYVALAIYLIVTKGSPFLLIGETVFLGAVLFWLVYMLPNTRRKSKYKAMSQGGLFTPQRTTYFYEENMMVVTDSGKETLIPYADILSWKETRHLIVISCKNKLGVMLDKNGFEIGNFKKIEHFLSREEK